MDLFGFDHLPLLQRSGSAPWLAFLRDLLPALRCLPHWPF